MKKFLLAGIVLFLAPTVALGATFMQKDEGELAIERPIADDLFAAGQQVVTKEVIEEDAFLAGQRVLVASDIGQDLMAGGQFVEVSGPVGDDLYAAGNTVTVQGTVAGDVALAAQSVTLGESAQVGREAYIAGQSVTVAGVIEGNARIAADQITVREGARIAGDLIVYGNQEPTVEEGATIGGNVELRRPPVDERPERNNALRNWVMGVLTSVVLALLALWLMRPWTASVIETLYARPLAAFLTGLLGLLLVLPVFVILLVSIVGIPIAFLLLAAAFIVAILSKAIVVLWLGQVLLKVVIKDSNKEALSWTHALAGAAVYEAVQLLGPVGMIVTFIIWLVGMGAVILSSRTLFGRSASRITSNE